MISKQDSKDYVWISSATGNWYLTLYSSLLWLVWSAVMSGLQIFKGLLVPNPFFPKPIHFLVNELGKVVGNGHFKSSYLFVCTQMGDSIQHLNLRWSKYCMAVQRHGIISLKWFLFF